MHVVVIFYNVGGYHAARLRAAQATCKQNGWQFTVVQETDSAYEHPWGQLEEEITFPLKTLMKVKDGYSVEERRSQSTVAASLLPACLTSLKPDVLVIPGWGYPISRAALKWAKQHRALPVLMSESKLDDAPRTWWKEQVKSLFYVSQFRSAIVGGQLHLNYLLRLGFKKDAIFLGYDVVDNDYFIQKAQETRDNADAVRRDIPEIPKQPYFIVVTRFIPRKNVLRLIDAFSIYRRASNLDQAWDLVICGSGAEESNIRTKIADYCLEDVVHLPGFKSYREIPSWFGLANAFIHPALSEQWGLVVNEALASGLPALVSNRCGCFPELIVEGKNGFGFDPENVEQLTQLMLKLSQQDTDIDAMKRAALSHIQNFSPAAFGHSFKSAIRYALSH